MRVEDKFALNEVLFDKKFRNNTLDKSVNSKNDSVGFGDILKKSIDDVNSKLVTSNSTTSKFIKGEDVNIDEVMIKNQEANLSLQFLTQTRDKLLDGYNQLSKLQL